LAADLVREYDINAAHYSFWVDRLLVGEAQLHHYPTEVELWGFEIYKPFRRHGYAREFMRRLLADGGMPMYLWVAEDNVPAIKLYSSMGFTEIYRSLRGIRMAKEH
jgi:ribosomal protein S18 acetylase RimI-like enzyme